MSAQYLPFYVGDYLRDTVDLDTSEHGAYVLLLAAAWSRGGELPADHRQLYRLAFASSASHRRAVDKVLGRFWKTTARGFVNPRLQKELAHLQERFEVKSRAGKKSAEVRRGNRSINTGDNTAAESVTNEAITSRPDQYQRQTSALPASPSPSSTSSSPPESAERARARARDGSGGGGDDTDRANQKIELLDNGDWLGVPEAQRLRWQDMFPNMSIPDQIARAGAWLIAHPEKRREYTDRGGLANYLVGWLLRESRPKATRDVLDKGH